VLISHLFHSVGVGCRICFKPGFPLYGAVNLTGRYPVFFDYPMGENGDRSPMEEEEDPVIHVLPAYAEFMYVIAKVIGFGAA